ncbi:porin [Janthinobacterium agaricidamnosum]|uniref:Gram-negative porin family protein n=1 Tax=Janthinobacterium agaricidamnosum NBRC 102515 = DSM 9628 TaxID=1349767 RepID=W0V9Z1_9BURK|nr:porin [Janthinobacterium agaricidamnosum]CDG84168.1 gram-negative porin family protein [Janthinobacterium agaricidamnosum NBRC 102515 = DSM 9628]
MKKTAFTLAAMAVLATAGSAHAQSNVSVYGLLDIGVENVNHSANGNNRVSSGGMNTSRWGIRGNEDLGGGLKAVFNLEGGLLLDSGASDGALFKRQAYVGLDGSYGRLVLGRSFSTVYDFVLPFDPMAYAPYYSWATSGNATGSSKYGMSTAFDNMVKYSGKAGDFKFGASYGFGEQSTGAADSAKLSTAVTYGTGPFSVLATYEKINGNTLPATGNRDKTTAYHLGAMYNQGPVKVQLAVRDFKQQLAKAATPDVRGTLYWGGLSYQTTPAITLTGVIYYQDVKNVAPNLDADPIMYVGRFRYALSKRTDLYVSAAYAKARHNQLVGLSRDEAGLANTQRGVITGIQHRF